MLVLSRKVEESILIGDNIEVKVLDVIGDKVQIGISAPKEIPIYRKEVYLQIQEANKSSMEGDGLAALKNIF